MLNIFILFIVISMLLPLLNPSSMKEYREVSSFDWLRITENILVDAPSEWTCRERTVFLAGKFIRREVAFSICYGFYGLFAHVWIEHNQIILDASVGYPEKRRYLKLAEFRITRSSKLTKTINLLSMCLSKKGRML